MKREASVWHRFELSTLDRSGSGCLRVEPHTFLFTLPSLTNIIMVSSPSCI
jgi:hypothetical protein